jgi:hypothetical protein
MVATLGDVMKAWGDAVGDSSDYWAPALPGPALEVITTRLTAIPKPFLDTEVDIAALAGDLQLGGSLRCLDWVELEPVATGAAVGLWLIASEELHTPMQPMLSAIAPARMVDALAMWLAPVSDPMLWLTNAQRREEAARGALLWAGYLPAGEDATTARSLWASLDSGARNTLIAQARESERHREEVRKRLADAAAKESAARYSRE